MCKKIICLTQAKWLLDLIEEDIVEQVYSSKLPNVEWEFKRKVDYALTQAARLYRDILEMEEEDKKS